MAKKTEVKKVEKTKAAKPALKADKKEKVAPAKKKVEEKPKKAAPAPKAAVQEKKVAPLPVSEEAILPPLPKPVPLLSGGVTGPGKSILKNLLAGLSTTPECRVFKTKKTPPKKRVQRDRDGD